MNTEVYPGPLMVRKSTKSFPAKKKKEKQQEMVNWDRKETLQIRTLVTVN